MHEKNRYWTYDTSICVGTKPGLYDFFERGKEGDWKSYNAVRRALQRLGYSFHQDPEVKKRHRTLAPTHHAGSKGLLHFACDLYQTGFKVEFYEDVVRDNPNGGRYHFDKLKKMPYLVRLQLERARQVILGTLDRLGFLDEREPVLPPLQEILKDRVKSRHNYATETQPDYNVQDADGVRLKDGDLRYFWTRNGRLARGPVYYNLNSMWWVITGPRDRDNVSVSQLFTYNSARPMRKLSIEPLVNISRGLRKAIERQDFERAAVIRDVIKRMAGEHDFKKGDQVQVENPRYSGPGVVQYVKPPLWVGVRLSNGNTWDYEWPTVSPMEVAKS